MRSEPLERFALPLLVVCGLLVPREARAEAEDYRKPAVSEQWQQPVEVEENSDIVRAINSVSDREIRAEGYRGDISVLKQRARSQIPLLYGFYDRVFSSRGDVLKALPYPQLNIDVLTHGIRIHYTIPDPDTLAQHDYAFKDIEAAINDIEKKVTAVTGMPVQRVDQKEDATIPFSFFIPKAELGRVIARSEMFSRTPHATVSFFPLGTVIPSEKNGVYVPLVGLRRYDRFLEEYGVHHFSLGLKQFLRKQSMRHMGIHEIIHAFGFLHTPDKDHLLALGSEPVVELVDKSVAEKNPAESYSDDDGRYYATRAYFRNIQNSPLVDFFLFLRIFAKQHAQQKGDEQR